MLQADAPGEYVIASGELHSVQEFVEAAFSIVGLDHRKYVRSDPQLFRRIQGPTFTIEFVNTQPDSAGNPANHIHCMWRDQKGDFALPRS